ncbi:ABC transporter permease [Neosynechococcus sphagnicola sy1]|uniref:ABC transporter permease n=2 Tax=Neosynechococcus TaxID=1501143 RepID=A0A098TM47_9CYAN|nr:ABC transporter permease [Neosynechococcus sphagnicola sy1]
MASIARRNLLEDLPRFLVAQAGIMFAVSLVTLQTGIQNGFTESSSQIIDQSKADIWVSSANMVHLGLSIPLLLERRNQAAAVAGVNRAEALIIQGSIWRDADDRLASVTVVGFQPEGQLFTPWDMIQGHVSSLSTPYTVIVDQASLTALDAQEIGDAGIVGALPARITGITSGTKSLVLGNLLFTSLDSAVAYGSSPLSPKLPCGYATNRVDCQRIEGGFPPKPRALATTDEINFVLVQAKPGEDLALLKQRLDQALPSTRAYTRLEMADLNQTYWQERSGIGFVLGLGAVVGVIVGVVVVGQILYASISEHLKEFGTLKAMGASNWVIYAVIGEQALWMAILGYLPGMVLCYGVAVWASSTQGILILITPISAVGVLGITIGMCLGASLFAIQRVTRVDPAIVFKG